MRLGTRWGVGGTPPASLPIAVLAAVRDVEAELPATSELSWTLTYLEGQPVVDLDDGTTVRYRPEEDRAIVTFEGAGDLP